MLRVIVRSKRAVCADDVDLSMFDRITLDASADGARVVIVYCEDETGNRFSYLGPLSSLEHIAPGVPFRPERHGWLFPLYRGGWPSGELAPERATEAFAFLRPSTPPRDTD